MKFQITKIEIENFRSIENKVTLAINPGLFCIEGINYDEKNSTNGVGKSSLVSALYWCLTGNTLTNEILADEVVNNRVGKNCKVIVHIDSDQGEIKITRARKDSELGNGLFLEIGGNDVSCHKVADTQARLNQLLKIPFDLLHSTIMMTSDMKSAFSELSPQQRIQTLESIRDYSLWDKVRDEANKDIKEYNKQINDLKLKMSNSNGSLTTYQKIIENTTKDLETLNLSFNLEIIEQTLKINENAILSEETQISEFNKSIAELKTSDVEKNEQNRQKLAEITEAANQLKLDIQRLEFDSKDITREITTLEKWFSDDKCPTCNRALDRQQIEIDTNRNKINDLLNAQTKLDLEIVKKNEQIAAKRVEYSDINKLISGEETIKKEIESKVKTFENQITICQTSIKAAEKTILELTTKRDTHQQKVLDLTNTLSKYNLEVKGLELEIVNLQKEIAEFETKRQLSDYYYKLLGAKGELRPYLLNKDIQYLNVCMQKYISKFFNNTCVELKLNGAAIDILIDSGGISKTVSSLSGGEKKRLNISIQLALYDLIQSTSQISFNTLWLDEIESQLDPLGCQQLIDIIEDKSEEISTVFWISNNSMVKENIPDKIVVEKKLGKTSVRA